MGNVDVKDNSHRISREVEAALLKSLKIIGMKAESYAKQLCRVDTGLLRNSITFALGGEYPNILSYKDNDDKEAGEYTEVAPKDEEGQTTLYVGTNVEYAPYIELGHHTTTGRWIDPSPFLRPAMEMHSDEYENVFKTELDRIK